MDRFIAHPVCNGFRSILCLKSNMDRFIDAKWLKTKAYDKLFKIQYGQIYSVSGFSTWK